MKIRYIDGVWSNTNGQKLNSNNLIHTDRVLDIRHIIGTIVAVAILLLRRYSLQYVGCKLHNIQTQQPNTEYKLAQYIPNLGNLNPPIKISEGES